MNIEKQAKQLLNDILNKYYNREKWDNRPLMQMIKDEMKNYNEEIAAEVNSIIAATLANSFTKSIPTVIPSPKKLSNMLYKNAEKVSMNTYLVLKAAQRSKKTAADLAMELYDGYNFKDERVLDVIEKMPKYVQKYLKNPSTQKDFIRQISKLKTKPYRTAMKELNKAVHSMDSKAVKKALKVVTEEKSRYYAKRIAETEVQRAKSLSNAKDMLDDDDIDLVKHEMSSRHPMYDICDIFDNADSGYGKGLYKKEDMVNLPHHPHCKCKYRPYYKKTKYKQIDDPLRKEIERQPMYKQRDALGSWDKVREFKEGNSPVSIWNKSRGDGYKIVPVKEIL